MSDIQPIVMPKWGLAMKEGMVAEWHIRPGAEISAGQEIMDIETSKIANVYESPVGGTLRKIVVEAGATVPVGALLGVVAPASVDDAAIDAYANDFIDNFDWDAVAGDAGPEPETVDANGIRMRYLKMGDAAGVPLIFIHGYGGDLNNWMFNQEALSAHRAAYALDLPGHGGSTKEVGAGDLQVFTSAVLAFMDAKKIGQAHLVGHSMGGAIVLALAAEHGHRVATLTLIAPAGFGSEINMDYINGFIEQTRAKKLRAVLELLVADPGSITAEMVEEVIRFKRLDGVGPALETLRDGLMPEGRQGMMLKDRLATLTLPVLVVWGKEDRVLPVAHADGLPDHVAVTIYDDAGHMPHMEKAAEVNALIGKLIEGGNGQEPPT
jgi:pyruvate dehydrogenase E2 component (dihydrolipoamide acetyltransferase)